MFKEVWDYGLNTHNEALIIEKAKSKKDGVYTFRGVGYRVRNNKITHFSANGSILERCYGFNVVIGKYKGFNNEGIKMLKTIKDK
jgi:hypothetical protein